MKKKILTEIQVDRLIDLLKTQEEELTNELENITDLKFKIQNFIDEFESIKERLHKRLYEEERYYTSPQDRSIAPEIWDQFIEKLNELSLFEEKQLVLFVRFIDCLYEEEESIRQIRCKVDPSHPDPYE